MDSPCVPSLRAYNWEALFEWLGADAATSVAAYRAIGADVGPTGNTDSAGYTLDWGCFDEGQCEEEEVGECGKADDCHYRSLFGGDIAESAPEGLWIVLCSWRQQRASYIPGKCEGRSGERSWDYASLSQREHLINLRCDILSAIGRIAKIVQPPVCEGDSEIGNLWANHYIR